MILIIIAGASASGKSQLATRLVTQLSAGGINAIQLKMDDYYLPMPEHLNLAEYKANTNFDAPNMVDFELLIQQLKTLISGDVIDNKPVFDFVTYTRSYEKLSPCDVIVLEGIFTLLLAKKLPPELTLVTVSVTTPSYMELLKRREKRDIEEGRRQTSTDVRRCERRTVGRGFFAYVAPTLNSADIQVLNDEYKGSATPHPLDLAVVEIIALLDQKKRLDSLANN